MSQVMTDIAVVGASTIVLLVDGNIIVAMATIHSLDLHNLAHRNTSILLPLGSAWVDEHLRDGVRTILYGANLLSNRRHALRKTGGLLGRRYMVMCLKNFFESGLDLGMCKVRRKLGMDSHAAFVGGHKEGPARVPGLEDEAVDLKLVSHQTASHFPFSALGSTFDDKLLACILLVSLQPHIKPRTAEKAIEHDSAMQVLLESTAGYVGRLLGVNNRRGHDIAKAYLLYLLRSKTGAMAMQESLNLKGLTL